MSDNGPVAERTPSSASRLKLKRMKRARELQQNFRLFYNKLQEIADLILLAVSDVVRGVRKCAMRRTCCINLKKQMFKLEHRFKKLLDRIKSFQEQISYTKLVIDNIMVEKLHDYDCTGSDECILKMQSVLKRDPLSLERKQEFSSLIFSPNKKVYQRCSPLHNAVMIGHVNCVKFLLENGAKVTSLTTGDDNILDSLYDELWFDDEVRLDILKLLLKYGVSRMFQHNCSGEFALKVAAGKSAEEVSLLLQHGAIMDRKESRAAIVEAWKMFDLSSIRELFLRHPSRMNFGPGSHILYEQIIDLAYMKMVLADVPIDLCHDKVLESLQVYKAFGGKFRMSPDLMQYLKRYKHRRHFSGAKLRIKEIISNPMSLQDISRLVIRKYIRKDYIENIMKLGLPNDLQSFLRFDNVVITERPENFNGIGDDFYSSSSGEDEDGSSDMEL